MHDGAAVHAAVIALLDEGKARDIVSIPLGRQSSIADYMVIAGGSSSRQLVALADRIAEALKEMGQPALGIEGKSGGDWILIDAGDVIVHLFRDEIREVYQLEKMWGMQGADVSAEPVSAESAAVESVPTESVNVSAQTPPPPPQAAKI